MKLFLVELKKVLLSLPFIIFVVVLLGFHFTQYGQEVEKLVPPEQGLDEYGFKQEEIPAIIIPAAIDMLVREFEQNSYVAYPFGFYKEVHLNDNDKKEMQQIIDSLDTDMNYEAFVKKMEQADQLIGGKSSYAVDALVRNFGFVEMTYEEALEEYNLVKNEDRFSNAYARYFADYTGLILMIVPIFMAVAISLKDQTARVADLIFSRAISSTKLMMTRFFALVLAIFTPVLVLAAIETYRLTTIYPNEPLNHLAFFSYSVGWLLPTVLFVVALGLFLTEWTGTILAVFIQIVLFFLSASVGLHQMMGGYKGWMLSIRHNTIGNTQVFLDNINTLLINRLVFTAVAAILLGLTIVVYEKKRKGMRTSYEWLKQCIQNRKD